MLYNNAQRLVPGTALADLTGLVGDAEGSGFALTLGICGAGAGDCRHLICGWGRHRNTG